MTSPPSPDGSKKGIWESILRGRRPGPLLGPWIGVAIVAALLYGFERTVPAFHQVVVPFYWILFGIALFASWRGLRARAGDRREADRRGNEPRA